MVKFRIFCFVIFLLNPLGGRALISDKRLCANADCTEPISLARTILKYPSPDIRILSLPANVQVTVYSKSAGSNLDLWGVEYQGKRGYVNKKFLRETKVLKKDLPFLVDTELAEGKPEVPSVQIENVTPAQQPYEVIDGTTIPLSPHEISPDSTKENVRATEEAFSTESPTPVLADNEKIEEKTSSDKEESVLEENEGVKDESMMDHMLSSIANFLDGGNSEEKKENEDQEDDDDESDENDEDDEENDGLLASRDDDDDEESEEQELKEGEEGTKKVKEIEDNELKENKETLENELKEKRNFEAEDEPIRKEDSVTLRNLLSEEKLEALSGEEISQSEEAPKEKLNLEPITDSPSVENEETPSPPQQEAFATTESALDVPTIDDYNIETVTTNPGKLEAGTNEKPQEEQLGNTTQDKPEEKEQENANVLGNQELLQENQTLSSVEETTSLGGDSNLGEKNIVEGDVPLVQEDVPVVRKEDNDEKLLVKEEVPLYEDVPTLKEEISTNREEVSTNKEEISTNPEEISSAPQDMPSNQQDMPSTQQEIEEPNPVESTPTIQEESPSTQQEIPSNQQDIQSNQQEIPSSQQEIPSSQQEIPSNQQEIPSYQQEIPSYQQEIPSSQQEIPSAQQEIPSSQQETLPTQEEPNPGQPDSTIQEGIPPIQQMYPPVQEEPPQLLDIPQETTEERPSPHGVYDSWFGASSEASEPQIVTETSSENIEEVATEVPDVNAGWGGFFDGKPREEVVETHEDNVWTSSHTHEDTAYDASKSTMDNAACPAGGDDCPSDIVASIQRQLEEEEKAQAMVSYLDLDFATINLNLIVALGIIGASVAMFLVGCVMIDKSRREAPLIAKINSLEKALLVSTKENQILMDKVSDTENETALEHSRISNEAFDQLQKDYDDLVLIKAALEEQIQTLEKELENSTEVGLELNKMLSDMLSSQNGSETLVANVEQLQRQLIEQQSTINSINDTLNLKDTENHELQLELEIKNKKVIDLQAELDKMALNLLKAEEEKELVNAKLETEIHTSKEQLDKLKSAYSANKNKLLEEINNLKKRNAEIEKKLELKIGEYDILRDSLNKVKSVKNNAETLESLLNVTTVKAEHEQMRKDLKKLTELLHQEKSAKSTLEKQVEAMVQEAQQLRQRYDEADKGKLEAQTKLEVLGNYFKEREAELQRELSKQESMWVEKQGEATSTTERIKYVQEELQNCKALNESLKQEIVSQEVELKSQISVLEKKAHESWVAARQAERRLDEAKQEAAQLRNRLTLKERSFAEDKGQQRMQSPLEQNGDGCVSPFDAAASPPLLYGTNDHLTASPPPPLPGMPPFLPPPPGVPFMPPPPGVPGFMPPPPAMFPVDHRPPPLGRMSSPPLNTRYSPDSRYSPYDDRRSPSPPYDDDDDDDDYSARRGYSPYERPEGRRENPRDYGKRPPVQVARTNGRKKGGPSSGSEHSTESIDRSKRHHPKI